MRRRVDIPTWMDDIIQARAQAMKCSYDEALSASLDIRPIGFPEETAGWAVSNGHATGVQAARRLHRSTASVYEAVRRFERKRGR